MVCLYKRVLQILSYNRHSLQSRVLILLGRKGISNVVARSTMTANSNRDPVAAAAKTPLATPASARQLRVQAACAVRGTFQG